jgi:hypothetical protein
MVTKVLTQGGVIVGDREPWQMKALSPEIPKTTVDLLKNSQLG